MIKNFATWLVFLPCLGIGLTTVPLSIIHFTEKADSINALATTFILGCTGSGLAFWVALTITRLVFNKTKNNIVRSNNKK